MRKMFIIMMACILLLPSFVKAAEWYEKIKLKGDFRFRHELIQKEEKEDRNRWRLRFRLGINAVVTDSWSVSARMATGSDDPVSTNQSLSGGFYTKDFRLDRAYRRVAADGSLGEPIRQISLRNTEAATLHLADTGRAHWGSAKE